MALSHKIKYGGSLHTHTYVSFCDTEVGLTAILDIQVAHVSFQAFARAALPQTQRAVERRCKNEFAIGRKPHKRYGRIVVINKSHEALTCSSVPNSTQTIVRAGYNQCSITVEVHSRYGV